MTTVLPQGGGVSARTRQQRETDACEERMRRLADKAQLLESAGVLSQRATSSFDADMRLETLAEAGSVVAGILA